MGEPQVLTVVEQGRIAAAGADGDVAAWVRRAAKADPARGYVVIDDATGRVVDIDLREPAEPKPPRSRGRARRGGGNGSPPSRAGPPSRCAAWSNRRARPMRARSTPPAKRPIAR